MNNIELICSLIGSAFAGGWLTKILTVRQEKKKVTAEADKMASDNWRELAEKFEERMNVLEGKVQGYTEVIMMTFTCQLLTRNPNSECPVQQAFKQMRDDEKGGENEISD